MCTYVINIKMCIRDRHQGQLGLLRRGEGQHLQRDPLQAFVDVLQAVGDHLLQTEAGWLPELSLIHIFSVGGGEWRVELLLPVNSPSGGREQPRSSGAVGRARSLDVGALTASAFLSSGRYAIPSFMASSGVLIFTSFPFTFKGRVYAIMTGFWRFVANV